MALFSRRGKPEEPHAAEPDEAVTEEPSVELPAEPVPEVGISFSTYGASAAVPSTTRAPSPASSAPRPAATAPASETAGRMPDNAVLRSALAALPAEPQNLDVMNVMRQALQGHLYVRVQGDAQSLLAAGQNLTLAVTAIEDKRFLLAFSGGSALHDSVRADGDTATSAVGQPALTVLRNVVAGPYAGLFLDHATAGARIILPSELVEKAVEEADPSFTIKTLLSSERSDKTAIDVVEALTHVKLWVAGNTDADGRMGLAEARSADGKRRLEVFSHPLEVIALGRGDRPLPLTGAQFAKALASDPGITGVVVDPAGPWIELDRAQLAPLLALAG